jgi:hypothetical protein
MAAAQVRSIELSRMSASGAVAPSLVSELLAACELEGVTKLWCAEGMLPAWDAELLARLAGLRVLNLSNCGLTILPAGEDRDLCPGVGFSTCSLQISPSTLAYRVLGGCTVCSLQAPERWGLLIGLASRPRSAWHEWRFSKDVTCSTLLKRRSLFGAGLGALTNLRELRVSGNKLTGLMQEIGQLRKLQCLAADNNLLASIPGATCTCALSYPMPPVSTYRVTHFLLLQAAFCAVFGA